jgi:hypothetical protein
MVKYKYNVFIYVDYIVGVFGEGFKDLLPNIGVTSPETQAISIKTDRILTEDEQKELLKIYQDGFEKINLPLKGKIIPTIRYMGTVEEIQKEPEEINILKL